MVAGVRLEQQHPKGKHKTTTVIVVKFSGALNAADAQDLGLYSLATEARGKKHPSRPVGLTLATYDPSAGTVTLTPRKKLVLKPPLQLRIRAAGLIDTLGRSLERNDDGQPGGDFVSILSK